MMKSCGLKLLSFQFKFPTTEEPSWKNIVPRWNQLDAYAYGLAQGAFAWQKEFLSPDFIILASPTASNETDKAFTDTGAISPSKFAHTLPNIRSSCFCQILPWSGPILCLQRDPETVIQSIKEGFELISEEFKRVLILTVVKSSNCYKVYSFELGVYDSPIIIRRRESENTDSPNDAALLKYFEGREKYLALGHHEILRKD